LAENALKKRSEQHMQKQAQRNLEVLIKKEKISAIGA
jgi:hypothetical protein